MCVAHLPTPPPPFFEILQNKLIIELDGSQHLEQTEYDTERTLFLESKGYRVMRIWNNDVMNDIESVLRAIDYALEEKKVRNNELE